MRRSSHGLITGLLLCAIGPVADLPGQADDALSGLASPDPRVRVTSTQLLTRRAPGDWLVPDLERAAKAPAEVRARFLSALGRNRALLPTLVAEFAKNDERNEILSSCLIASFEANRWETYDLVGNVSEWIEDVYNDDYVGAPRDGSAWYQETGAAGERRRVVRGGGYDDPPPRHRLSRRSGRRADNPNRSVGFRCVADE